MSNEPTDLERRVRRCEALSFAAILGGTATDDPEFREMLRFWLRRGEPFDEELYYLLDRYLRERRQQPERYDFQQVFNRVQRLEGAIHESQGAAETVAKRFAEARSTQQAFEQEIRQSVSALADSQRGLQGDTHTYLVAQSMGIDLLSIPLPRFIPIRVYLSQERQDAIQRVTNAVERLTKAFGFQLSDDFPAEKGSWWKRWFARTTDVVTQPEVVDRLKKLERALELKGVAQPQAEVDKTEAEAAATIIKAVENIPNVAIQIGSLLIVKVTHPNGNCLQLRTLTQRELLCLEQNQALLTSPTDVLARLTELSKSKAAIEA